MVKGKEQVRRGRPVEIDLDWEAVSRDYERDMSLRRMAKKYGVSHMAIQRGLKRIGCHLRSPGNPYFGKKSKRARRNVT